MNDGEPSSLRSKNSDLFASVEIGNTNSRGSTLVECQEKIDNGEAGLKQRLASEDTRPDL